MSSTHGGRYKIFKWELLGDRICIRNEEGREHTYSLIETYETLKWLKENFGEGWFPLANNVELMANGKEKNGLGTAILNQVPNDISHAQGASYLGVVLEEVGILGWNGAKKGIQWRIIKMPETINALNAFIINYLG
jgi:hypothetical protein